MATWETVREVASRLPETIEGTSYGTPAVRVRKRLLVRLRDEGDVLVVSVGQQARAALLAADDPAFFSLPHYDGDGSGYILVRLPLISGADLRDTMTDAWLNMAPVRLTEAWRQDRARSSAKDSVSPRAP